MVAVPIGNPGDLTIRAKEILESVAVVACEETAKFRALVRNASLSISGKILPHHSYNENNSALGLIKILKTGEDVALVSSAGTPRVSDPGYHIVRLAHEESIQIVPIPGPSALATAMSICPMPLDPLIFLGFISPKPGRRANTLKQYSEFNGTICLYESVHRIEKLLLAIDENLPGSEIFIARELTKRYEEYYWGSLTDALQWIKEKKGEFVLFFRKND